MLLSAVEQDLDSLVHLDDALVVDDIRHHIRHPDN
jgi:hypothetical protein